MNRDGFTLVEVVVGMLILMVGVLALASTTGFVSMQMRAAELRTDRTVVQQQAMERMRTMDFDAEVVSVAKGSGATLGDYTVWWDVASLDWGLKEISLYTEGPGFRDGSRQPAVVDTITVRMSRTLQ